MNHSALFRWLFDQGAPPCGDTSKGFWSASALRFMDLDGTVWGISHGRLLLLPVSLLGIAALILALSL